jgi:hypothetical protein
MRTDLSTRLLGWALLASAVMLWAGWALLPHHLGTHFVPEDFPPIHARVHLWLWLFRVHLFGLVTGALAFGMLAAVLADSPARILAWPGAAVLIAGLFVTAVAAAFYYHFGVYGALETHGKPAAEVRDYVDSLRVSTEYVTCLVRFGRVFSGLGLFVLSLGLLAWNVTPRLIGGAACAIGLSAMALTMGLPDRLELYAPLLHANAAWLAVTGVVTLRSGLRVAPPQVS